MRVKKINPGQKVTGQKLERAKDLRREMTNAEAMLWNELRANRLGVHFRRQQIIAGYIIVAITAATAVGCGARGEWGNIRGVELVVPAADPPIESVVWSPTQNDQVLATSTDLNHSDSRVYLQNLTTGEGRVLVRSHSGSLRGLALSPNGKQALVMQTTGAVGEPSQLLLVDVETLETELLAERAGSGAWSRNGAALAYFSHDGTLGPSGQALTLRLRNTETGAERTLHASPAGSEMGLSWSPDNERIVFSLGEPTASQLYVVDVQSGRTTQITTSGIHNSPAWSPRDDIIAYQSYTGDGVASQIRLIRSNGDCEFTLPQLNYVWSPTWLPDAATPILMPKLPAGTSYRNLRPAEPGLFGYSNLD